MSHMSALPSSTSIRASCQRKLSAQALHTSHQWEPGVRQRSGGRKCAQQLTVPRHSTTSPMSRSSVQAMLSSHLNTPILLSSVTTPHLFTTPQGTWHGIASYLPATVATTVSDQHIPTAQNGKDCARVSICGECCMR